VSRQVVKLRHYQGERLRASDLREDDNELTTFRQLHIRALHDAWGIALGLEVYLVTGAQFAVSSGLAYDRLGREIVLQTAQSAPALTADAGDGSYYLVIRTSDDRQPLLHWRTVADTQLGVDVPLLAAQITSGALDTVDFAVRRYTRPLSRPHIAHGLTALEQRWRVWRKAGGERQVGFGMRVDTSAAGFVTTPFYVASIHQSGNALLVGKPNATQVQMYIFKSIANVSPTGFTLRVVIAGPPPTAQAAGAPPPSVHDIFQRFSAGNLPFRVAWIGLEPLEACAPIGL